MEPKSITPENTTFVLLSFEGPDRYSLAGGLGVRVTELANSLAETGYYTHLFFVGDPFGDGEEKRQGGRLVLHRWCQWISQYHPDGVYQGEEGKIADFNESIPPFLTDCIIRPAVAEGKIVVVMGEEWHTAETMCRLSDFLYHNGLRDKVLLLWNANNTMSFDRINWGRLSFTTTVTTVSKYMKHIMWGLGVNPLVIPNGIPRKLLDQVDEHKVIDFRSGLNSDVVLFKMARWHPDKCWNQAVEAVARLKALGLKTTFLLRGGIEPYEGEIVYNARRLGLSVRDVTTHSDNIGDQFRAVTEAGTADLMNLKFFVTPEFARVVYAGSDGVLANSGHEPFGLVGLEAMAAGGIAFTGATGEDYAIPLENAIVLETGDPGEIVGYLTYLQEHQDEQEHIRLSARRTARQYTWEEVIDNLVSKLEFLARKQGLLASLKTTEKPPRDAETIPDQKVSPATYQIARQTRMMEKAAELVAG